MLQKSGPCGSSCSGGSQGGFFSSGSTLCQSFEAVLLSLLGRSENQQSLKSGSCDIMTRGDRFPFFFLKKKNGRLGVFNI